MSTLMSDLVGKAQKKNTNKIQTSTPNGLYRYKSRYKRIEELAEIGGISVTTLINRFKSNNYTSVQNAVHNKYGSPRRSEIG